MKLFSWLGIFLATLFLAFLSFLSINEWWNVEVKNNIDGYPWGLINDNPWYYENSKLYSTVMLIEGITIFVILLILLFQIFKRSKKGIIYSIISGFIVLIVMIISGNIN